MAVTSSRQPNFRIVFFDLEMTGLSVTDEIIQIGAVHGNAEYNQHVKPTGSIPREITDLTGISMKDSQMYHSGQAVDSVSPNVAANSFLSFLRSLGGSVILVSHNCFKSDGPMLTGLMDGQGMIPNLKAVVVGFADTFPLLKSSLPAERATGTGYKLSAMAEEFLGSSAGSHDAIGDARMLEKLIGHDKIPVSADAIINSRQIVGLMTHKYKCRLDSYRRSLEYDDCYGYSDPDDY